MSDDDEERSTVMVQGVRPFDPFSTRYYHKSVFGEGMRLPVRVLLKGLLPVTPSEDELAQMTDEDKADVERANKPCDCQTFCIDKGQPGRAVLIHARFMQPHVMWRRLVETSGSGKYRCCCLCGQQYERDRKDRYMCRWCAPLVDDPEITDPKLREGMEASESATRYYLASAALQPCTMCGDRQPVTIAMDRTAADGTVSEDEACANCVEEILRGVHKDDDATYTMVVRAMVYAARFYSMPPALYPRVASDGVYVFLRRGHRKDALPVRHWEHAIDGKICANVYESGSRVPPLLPNS